MAERKTIREMLATGRRLEAGGACEVAALLLKNARRTGQVVECLWDEEPGVANRAAYALKRASSRRPEILLSWKEALLDRMLDADENKLRWNLALTIFRTPLSKAETERAAAVLRTWLDDESSIVKTCALHGLAGLTRWDAWPEWNSGDAGTGAHFVEADGSWQRPPCHHRRLALIVTSQMPAAGIGPRGSPKGILSATLWMSPGDKLTGQGWVPKTHMVQLLPAKR